MTVLILVLLNAIVQPFLYRFSLIAPWPPLF